MKYLIAFAALTFAGPVLAHTGEAAHLHPHDGASWLAVVAALGVVAVAAKLVALKARADAAERRK